MNINYDLENIKFRVKNEGLDVCIISYGGSCTNLLFNILKKNGYNIKHPYIWAEILCHYPDYIKLDIPIIYIYDNIKKSYLSMKRRGINRRNYMLLTKCEFNNSDYSDENLLKQMIFQYHNWTKIKYDNVLIIKSNELFKPDIKFKLQNFLKNDNLISIPAIYRKPQIDLNTFILDNDDQELFKKYNKEIDDINITLDN
jgi:hypothetical protein